VMSPTRGLVTSHRTNLMGWGMTSGAGRPDRM